MASLTRWTWVWVNSGSWWWTGRPGVLQFMGSQRVGHDWATELMLQIPYLLNGVNDIPESMALLWELINTGTNKTCGKHSINMGWTSAYLDDWEFGITIYLREKFAQLCPTLCDPMNCSTPGLPAHHQLPEFTQTHLHRVSDAIQPCHPLSSPSLLATNPSQYQSLFQRSSQMNGKDQEKKGNR